MAFLPRGLGLLLTVWMIGLRPPTIVRTGSSDSAWWDAKESQQLLDEARVQIAQGNYAAAGALFERGAQEAKRRSDPVAAARYLSGVASAHTVRFQYRAALQGFLEARQLAKQAGDRYDTAMIALNLSSLYGESWDLESA